MDIACTITVFFNSLQDCSHTSGAEYENRLQWVDDQEQPWKLQSQKLVLVTVHAYPCSQEDCKQHTVDYASCTMSMSENNYAISELEWYRVLLICILVLADIQPLFVLTIQRHSTPLARMQKEHRYSSD